MCLGAGCDVASQAMVHDRNPCQIRVGALASGKYHGRVVVILNAQRSGVATTLAAKSLG
jgi:hypothetical protein